MNWPPCAWDTVKEADAEDRRKGIQAGFWTGPKSRCSGEWESIGKSRQRRGWGGRAELVADREDWFEDEATVVLYENGQFEEMMVSDLARQAVAAKQTTSGGNAS